MNVLSYGALGLLLCVPWSAQAAETAAEPDRHGLPQRFAAYLEQHRVLAEKKTSLATGQVAEAAAVERRHDPLTTFDSFIFGIHRHRARLLAAEQSERWEELVASHTPVTRRWHDERNLVRCLFECSRWDYAMAGDDCAGEARRDMEQWLDLRMAWMFQEEVAHHRFCRAAWQILTEDQRRNLLSGEWDAWVKKSTGHEYPLWAERIVTRALGKPPNQAAFDEATAAQKAAYSAPHARYTAAAARHRRIGLAMDLNNEDLVVASWHEMAPSFRAIVLAEAEAIRALVHTGYASSAVDVAAKAGRAKRALWNDALERFPDGQEVVKLTAAALPPAPEGLSPSAAAARAPLDLGTNRTDASGAPNYASASVLLGDGSLESYFRRATQGRVSIFGMRSTDNGRGWSAPEVILSLPVEPWGGPVPLVDREGELHFVIPKARGRGRKPNVDRFIDLYHIRSTDNRIRWTEPARIYEGYCGSIQGLFQLGSGRIIAPFADWLPGVPTAPPTGPSVVTCVYSDDGGATWQRSPARLTAPCHADYNGSNYGACEPTLIELNDGRVWMFIRTQDGFLYESFSSDGREWSPARRSSFHSSNSPAFPVRLRDGRIVLFWNNCQMPPRVGRDGVYGGRDALHAAVSADEGKTWRGFREVYRDPTRNASPPKDGDRGTAYPHATPIGDGRILLVSGQGVERRRRFLIDPDWLVQKSQSEDFANLDAWHVFKGFGKPVRFWRDRVQGAELVPHPDKPDRKVLRLRRPDDRDADGAAWNFPAGHGGKLRVRLRIGERFGGAQISLADRMFDPCDDAGEKQAAFAIAIDPQGRISGGAKLQPDEWQSLELHWTDRNCAVVLNGKPAGSLACRAPASHGLSYLRLRSTASAVDAAGLLVESVNVEVE